MSKYYLVACYYDMHKKSYTNEITIKKLNNITLSSLIKIDDFTTKHSETEILNMIEKEFNIRGINHLSIKYVKNDYETPVYYKVITNNKEFNSCINSTQIKELKLMDKKRKTSFISLNNDLLKNELTELLKILNTKNYALFQEVYPKENDFSFLVKNYMNSNYDNELYSEEELRKIILEFSRYKTFRGWIINKALPKTKKTSQNIIIKKESIKHKKINSIEENIAFYENEFEKRTGDTYSSYTTTFFNQENDEYLSEEEYNQMNGYSKIKY